MKKCDVVEERRKCDVVEERRKCDVVEERRKCDVVEERSDGQTCQSEGLFVRQADNLAWAMKKHRLTMTFSTILSLLCSQLRFYVQIEFSMVTRILRTSSLA